MLSTRIIVVVLAFFASTGLSAVVQAQDSMGRLGKNTKHIRELMARKQWTKAARQISSTAPEAQLVRGSALLKGKQPKEALIALNRAQGKTKHLNDFVQLKRAEAFLALDRPKEMLAALADIKMPVLMGTQLKRMKARALRETDQKDKAKTAYQTMLKGEIDSEIPIALLGLARLSSENKDPKSTLDYIKRLDVEYPTHWTAKKARILALTTVATHPTLIGKWRSRTPQEKLKRGEAFLKRHRNRAAIRELSGLNTRLTEIDDLCRQQYALGRALRKRRKWKRARPILAKAIQSCKKAKSDLAPWAIHLAGRAAETVGAEDESARIFRLQVRENPAHRLADDAAYYLVRDAIDDRNDLPRAERLLTKFVSQFPQGDMMPDGVFFVVAHAFEKKQYRRALRVLNLTNRLKGVKFNDSQMGRTTYWKARILGKLGQRSKARQLYHQTMKNYPLSWYSFLAFSRLTEWNSKKAKTWARKAFDGTKKSAHPFEKPDTALTTIEQVRWKRASALAYWGLARDAWSLLQRGDLTNESQLWSAAKLLDTAGAYSISYDILRRKLSSFRSRPSGNELRQLWTVAYPRPFTRLVRKASQAAGVPMAFVQGVIREESGFNVAIESFANAVGLMQLLVPTGRMVARKHEGKITRRRLQDPDINVTLGARFLAYVERVSGAVRTLVPPGYNAGPGAVKRWLKRRGHLPLDLFVELIPYQEARDYTKKVNASFGIYRYLYASKALMYIGQKTRSAKKRKTRKRKRSSKKRRRTRR